MPTSRIDAAAADVAASLRDPSLARVSRALDRRGLAAECRDIVSRITTIDGLQDRVCAIRADVQRDDPAMPAGALERVLILQTALDALRRLGALPVSDDVKRLFCEEFEYMAHPSRAIGLDAAKGSFVAFCQLATFRRFPAGQFHWDVSGIPRSWLLDAKGRDRLRLFYWIAAKLRGFRPVFFSHLNANRRNRSVLTEREANRSYYRMAQSMALQPAVKGLVTCSWLHSPDTFAASPHLAWVNRPFLEHGGLVVVLGPADPHSGVLTRSPERQKLYEAGRFKPTTGLAVWPRAQVLGWAERHPEFAETEERRDVPVACHAR
jgi:hypothetical protein